MSNEITLEAVTSDRILRLLKHCQKIKFKRVSEASLLETPDTIANASRLKLVFDDVLSTTSGLDVVQIQATFLEKNAYYMSVLRAGGFINDLGEPTVTQSEYCKKVLNFRNMPEHGLLYQPIEFLDEYERSYFVECFEEALTDFRHNLDSPAFQMYENHWELGNILILVRTILHFMNYRITPKDFGNLEVYTNAQIEEFIKAHGIPVINQVTTEQLRNIAKNISYLIHNKGKLAATIRAMEVLDYEDVELFWYLLFKRGNYDQAFDVSGNPVPGVPLQTSLAFAKIPYREVISDYVQKMGSAIETVEYADVVSGDSTWKITEEEIKSVPRQAFRTKYLGAKSVLKLRSPEEANLLFYWAESFRPSLENLNTSQLTVLNTNISATPCFIADIFIAITCLTLHILGEEDVIPDITDGRLTLAFTESANPMGYWDPVESDCPVSSGRRIPGVNSSWLPSDLPENPAASEFFIAFNENMQYYQNCNRRMDSGIEVAYRAKYPTRYSYYQNNFYRLMNLKDLYPGAIGYLDHLNRWNPGLADYVSAAFEQNDAESRIFQLKGLIQLFISQYSAVPISCFPKELKQRMPAVALLEWVQSYTVQFMDVTKKVINTANIVVGDIPYMTITDHYNECMEFCDITRILYPISLSECFETCDAAKLIQIWREAECLGMCESPMIYIQLFVTEYLKFCDNVAVFYQKQMCDSLSLGSKVSVHRDNVSQEFIEIGESVKCTFFCLRFPEVSIIRDYWTNNDTWSDADYWLT